jgi:hypothetical protein
MRWFAIALSFALAHDGFLSAEQRSVIGAQPTGAFVLEEATVRSIHAAFDSKQLTCVQLIRSSLDRIERYDD